MIAGIETENGSCDPDHASFTGGLSSVDSDDTFIGKTITPLSGIVCHPLAKWTDRLMDT